jgi:hypothetical protein
MLGAMILLLVVVGAFALLRDANRTTPESPVEPVEWRSVADYAREQADFRLVAPRRLPPGWVATSVRFEQRDDQAWHLGMLTDEGRYVGLEQARDSVDTMVEQYVDEQAERGDDVVIDGRTWQRWSDDRDEALVRQQGEATTLVVGTAAQEVMVDFVRLLR